MEYYKPILILFISLLIFHLFLIRLFPQTKLFWKKIDYLWISLGLIGVIGSMFSARSEYSKARNNVYEDNLKMDYNGLIKSVKWNEEYFRSDGTGFNYDEFNDKSQAERYKAAEAFYQSFSSLALKLRDTIVVEKTLNYIDTLSVVFAKFTNSIKDDYVVETGENVYYDLKELKKTQIEYLENKDFGSRSSLNWNLLFISPYLFAFAIAIRLTKVTAEIMELRKTTETNKV